jgi:hypothetical protein
MKHLKLRLPSRMSTISLKKKKKQIIASMNPIKLPSVIFLFSFFFFNEIEAREISLEGEDLGQSMRQKYMCFGF